MENLSTLISSLSPGEEKLIRHFYKLREFGEYRKRVQLLDIIASGKAKDELSLAKLMGYKSLNASYHNLKSRLKSDILCILLMQESTSKFNTPFAQAAFSCRRALLTGELLLSRGVYHEGINLLRKAAKVAAKFELYAERIIAEDALRNHHASANASEELNHGTEVIDTNYRLLGNMMKSKKKLYETAFMENTPAAGENDFDYTNQSLTELNDLENESDSSRVRFYSQLSKLNIFNTTGDLHNALECAKGLLDSVEKDPIVMSKSNKAGIELEIAHMYLRASDFPNALMHAQRATGLFKAGMINHIRAQVLVFYAQVHSGLYDAAQLCLQQILASRSLKDRAHIVLQQRLTFLKAWFHFVKGEFDSASATIRSCSELVKEKGPWLFGYNLLENLLLIEKGAYEAALYKLEALRKLAARAGKEPYINRTIAIVGILRQLIRHENDHTRVLNSRLPELEKLVSRAPGYEWDPAGFELVRVEEWMLMRGRR